jgi:hypothetical protein
VPEHHKLAGNRLNAMDGVNSVCCSGAMQLNQMRCQLHTLSSEDWKYYHRCAQGLQDWAHDSAPLEYGQVVQPQQLCQLQKHRAQHEDIDL